MLKTYTKDGITVEIGKNSIKIRANGHEANFLHKPSIYMDEVVCIYYDPQYGTPQQRGYASGFWAGDDWIREGCLNIIKTHYFPKSIIAGLCFMCEEMVVAV